MKYNKETKIINFFILFIFYLFDTSKYIKLLRYNLYKIKLLIKLINKKY
jgi:hypothetical protein